MAGVKVDPLGEASPTDQGGKPLKFNQYATKKTLAQGLLDIGLLMANASQLKALIGLGPSHDYYYPNMVLVSLSIILQIIVGIILLVLGAMEAKTPEEKRHAHTVNDITVGLIFAITVINVFVAAFGIKITDG